MTPLEPAAEPGAPQTVMADRIYLAPMEGIADAPMRQLLTGSAAYDDCTSEFIRVTDLPLPRRSLLRRVPELSHGCRTPAGTPVRVQLLGDNPGSLLETARRAVELGAGAIDLNFGCPSRFVHHGGAALLREPELLRRIVLTVREGLDEAIALTVKIRSGADDKRECAAIVRAVAQPGVAEITIHARTRRDLYRRELLDWSVIAAAREFAGGIPLVANGDIDSAESLARCSRLSACRRFMIGRGALMAPNLPDVLLRGARPWDSRRKLQFILEFLELLEERGFPAKSVLDRTRQLMAYMRQQDISLAELFPVYCHLRDIEAARSFLQQETARTS